MDSHHLIFIRLLKHNYCIFESKFVMDFASRYQCGDQKTCHPACRHVTTHLASCLTVLSRRRSYILKLNVQLLFAALAAYASVNDRFLGEFGIHFSGRSLTELSGCISRTYDINLRCHFYRATFRDEELGRDGRLSGV